MLITPFPGTGRPTRAPFNKPNVALKMFFAVSLPLDEDDGSGDDVDAELWIGIGEDIG